MVSQIIKKLFHKIDGPNLTAQITTSAEEINHIYTTDDRIEGKVNIYLRNDLQRDASRIDLNVALVGRATVTMENLHAWAGANASRKIHHTFLVMHEPCSTKDIREIYTFETGTRLETQFAFTVPEKLLPSACSHEHSGHSQVIDSHIHLPPSITIKDISRSEVARVSYVIRARIRLRAKGKVEIAEEEHPIRILPLNSNTTSIPLPRYSLHQGSSQITSTVAFGNGRLDFIIKHLPMLRVILSPDGEMTASTITLKLYGQFESDNQREGPPQLLSVQNKIHAYTFTSLTPFETEPLPHEFVDYIEGKTKYSESIVLPQLDFGPTGWTRSNTNTKLPICTTSLRVPITLDTEKDFRFLYPTFSSCLICRTYVLETRISYCNSGNVGKSDKKTFKIRTPLQVSVTQARDNLSQ